MPDGRANGWPKSPRPAMKLLSRRFDLLSAKHGAYLASAATNVYASRAKPKRVNCPSSKANAAGDARNGGIFKKSLFKIQRAS